MKLKAISFVVMIAVLFGAIAMPSPVSAKKGLSTPITGTVENGGTFKGNLEITEFGVQDDQLVAFGTLSGKLTNAAGKKIGKVDAVAVAVPVSKEGATSASVSGVQIAQTCDILNLVLGPLDLNLLGLEVDLDTVVLDIVANPAGGLLGDLLCAVANLLDLGPLADLLQIASLLNQILALLG